MKKKKEKEKKKKKKKSPYDDDDDEGDKDEDEQEKMDRINGSDNDDVGCAFPTTRFKGSRINESGYLFPRSRISDEEWAIHENRLRLLKKETPLERIMRLKHHGVQESMKMFEVQTNSKGVKVCSVPVHYGLVHFGLPEFDMRWPGTDLPDDLVILPHVQLWDNDQNKGNLDQKYALQVMCTRIKKRKIGGIVDMGTGTGKTKTALFAAREIGKCTIIECPLKILIKQWEATIYHMFGDKVRVAILRGSKISVKKRIEIQNAHFLIISAQSHAATVNPYGGDMLSRFGFAILDECHTFAAPKRIRAVQRLARVPISWHSREL